MTRKIILPLLTIAICAPLLAQGQTLDTTSFIVVGGGLSAGYANSRLIDKSQKDSYPVFMATQMGTTFALPLFSPIAPAQSGAPAPMTTFHEGDRVTLAYFNPLPNLLAPVSQSVLRTLPFPTFTFNISIPFIKVSETLNTKPSTPYTRELNLKQSMINLILGYPELVVDNPPIWSQIEYAEQMAPTFVILELGYGDIIEAALTGDTSKITSVSSFTTDYDRIAARISKTFAYGLALNVPDPTVSAYFSTIDSAAKLYSTTPAVLMATFGLQSGDLITLGGLVEIGWQFSGRRTVTSLSSNSVLKAAAVTAVKNAVQSYNSAIATVAQKYGFLSYDLNSFVQLAAGSGVPAGSYTLRSGYLQGFYSRDGLFPTPTANAALANRLLALINSTYKQKFSLVDVNSVANRDDLVPKSTAVAGSQVIELSPSPFRN